jgi:hypothetical protein
MINICNKMLQKLNSIIGSGEEGTVADKFNRQRVRGHPKGIPKLVLIASLLDPRMKSGLRIPPIDKEQIWSKIQNTLIHLALEDNVQIQEQEPSVIMNNNNNQQQQRGCNGDEHQAPLIDEAADH